jgi:hypothetical protein
MQIERSGFDVAWAAGLFEGEGCLHESQRRGRIDISARLTMCDEDIVRRFATVVGFGTVRGPIESKRPNHNPTWEWYTQRRALVFELIALFAPYFGDRRSARARDLLALGDAKPLNERTHCPKGHPYSGDNLVLEPIQRAGRSYYARRCKTCRQEQSRERARKRLGIDPENYRVQ